MLSLCMLYLYAYVLHVVFCIFMLSLCLLVWYDGSSGSHQGEHYVSPSLVPSFLVCDV